MEYLSGCLLKPALITREIALELGKSLAIIHSNQADGFGYLHRDPELVSEPICNLKKNLSKGLMSAKIIYPPP